MRRSVAANYDSTIVSQLAESPVDEVYGRLPFNAIGGSRPAYMGAILSEESLADCVRTLQDKAFESRNCSELNCAECGYCQTIESQSVRLDETRRLELLDRFEDIRNMLVSGKLWHA